MKEQELKDVLNKVEISEEMQNRILEKTKKAHQKEGYPMKSKKKLVIITLAATLALGTTAFAANYFNWSSGFLSSLHISKNQSEELQNNQLVTMPAISDTHDGITVSTQQCLFDGNVLHLSFYVEGYELDETIEPELEYINILFDDKEAHNYDWSFFNGIDWTDRENPVMTDGTPVKEDENGNYIRNYRIADGKMEINLNMYPVDDNGKRLSEKDLEGKKITVIMQNFADKTGKWTLEWNLGSFEDGTEFTLNEKLGDSNATLTSVTLYPASAIIHYHFPKTIITIPGVDQYGNEIETTDFVEPPSMIGVKLKDGTIYTDLQNGGSFGYENDNEDECVARINFSRIIDVKEVKSLLFLKEHETAMQNITENDCYVLDIQ